MSAADTILQALTQHYHREPTPHAAAIETLADYDALRDSQLRDFAPVFTTSDGTAIPATELKNSLCGCLIQGVGPHTLLNLTELAEKHECQGDGSTPDFFKVGRTYTDGDGFTAPEVTTYFLVEHVTRHPVRGHLRALGWSKTGLPDATWHGDFRDEDEFAEWTDVTEDGA